MKLSVIRTSSSLMAAAEMAASAGKDGKYVSTEKGPADKAATIRAMRPGPAGGPRLLIRSLDETALGDRRSWDRGLALLDDTALTADGTPRFLRAPRTRSMRKVSVANTNDGAFAQPCSPMTPGEAETRMVIRLDY